MTEKLTEAQAALLRSGISRADHCILAPTGKGVSKGKPATKMINAGWLKEIRTKSGASIWRTDEETGTMYSLKLTAAGLKIVAAHDTRGSRTDAAPPAPSREQIANHDNAPAPTTETPDTASAPANFRDGSKLAETMKLLGREGGITVGELSTAMNWLPHSTRAVLTGLRKRGVIVVRRKMPDQRASAYAIETDRASANGQG